MGVVDLTSSLYLGLTHPSARLAGWAALTAGIPAALGEPALAGEVGERLRSLLGVGAVRIAVSTLHAFTDLAGALASDRSHPPSLAVDVAAYPVGRLALRAAVSPPWAQPVRLPHYAPAAVGRWADEAGRRGLCPVLLIDGFCPGCGRAAPLGAVAAAAVAPAKGLVVVDDTQGLGLLGRRTPGQPWGSGGGGAAAHAATTKGIVVVASLAKAFGAPLAVVAGPEAVITEIGRHGLTVVHSSQASLAHLRAAERALNINLERGDRLRSQLLHRVRAVRSQCEAGGLPVDSGLFPVVRVAAGGAGEVVRLTAALATRGVRTVPLGPSCRGRPALGLALRADLDLTDLRRAVGVLTTLACEAA